MNIEEIRANAAAFAARLVPQTNEEKSLEQEKEELVARKAEIEKELVRMRKKRYNGTDDDVAEDIVEELYRELLQVEAKLEALKDNK